MPVFFELHRADIAQRGVQPAAAEWAERTACPPAGAMRGKAHADRVQAEPTTESEAYAARQLLRPGTEVDLLAPASLRAALEQRTALDGRVA